MSKQRKNVKKGNWSIGELLAVAGDHLCNEKKLK